MKNIILGLRLAGYCFTFHVAVAIAQESSIDTSSPVIEGFNGKIEVDVRDSEPDWTPFTPKRASEGSPNILFVLYDDTGLGAWSPYGGRINMPTLDRLAAEGLTYTQWHTTALCSPTRSTLLTGRNHHLNGMASITETADGFPGANGRLPDQVTTIAEVLRDNGYSTFWVGKNHNVPEQDVAPGGVDPNGRPSKVLTVSTGFWVAKQTTGIRISSRIIVLLNSPTARKTGTTCPRTLRTMQSRCCETRMPPTRQNPGTCGSILVPTTPLIMWQRSGPTSMTVSLTMAMMPTVSGLQRE